MTKDLNQIYPTMKDGFHFIIETKKGVRHDPDFDGMSAFFKEELGLKTHDSFMWLYEENHYRPISQMELLQKITRLLPANTSPVVVRSFRDAIKAQCYDLAPDPKDGFINLKNGILDVSTGEMLPHSKDYFFKYILDHEFKPEATCPNWLAFLNRIFEGDKELIDLASEIFGYTLIGGTPWLHKAFILYGEGRNGKSTFLDVLKKLIGIRNVSTIPLQNLDKPFSVVMADGKLANITGEITTKEISSDAFKTAVGGEELIAANKGQPEYSMPFKARLIFATNKRPFFKDSTTGNVERLCMIPFNYYIKPEDRSPDFAQKELFPELSGVLNWALDGVRRLQKCRKITHSKKVADEVEVYREDTDSVAAWQRQWITKGNMEIVFVVRDYYTHYENWCAAERRHAVSIIEFGRRVSFILRNEMGCIVTRSQYGTKISGRVIVTASKKFLNNSDSLFSNSEISLIKHDDDVDMKI